MSTQPQRNSTDTSIVQAKPAYPAVVPAAGPAGTVSGPDGRGTTTIVDDVVATVAGIAAAGIPGVYALGGGAARALGSIRDAIGQKDLTQGISVEVGQTQVAVDLTMVVEYPFALQEVAGNVRDAVFTAVEDLVGMEVTEVNVTITDIHIGTDGDKAADTEKSAEARVL